MQRCMMYRAGAEMQKCRNAEVQRCSGRDAKAEVQIQRRMFRRAGAEVQV